MEAIRLSELGSTSSLETSLFQALSAGNGTALSGRAPTPRSAPAIEPYCQGGCLVLCAASAGDSASEAESAVKRAAWEMGDRNVMIHSRWQPPPPLARTPSFRRTGAFVNLRLPAHLTGD